IGRAASATRFPYTTLFRSYDDAVTVSQVSGPSGSISQTSGTSGTWTWTQSGALDEGSYTVVVKATGDQDSPTTSFTFTVTDVAPSIAVTSSSGSAENASKIGRAACREGAEIAVAAG